MKLYIVKGIHFSNPGRPMLVHASMDSANAAAAELTNDLLEWVELPRDATADNWQERREAARQKRCEDMGVEVDPDSLDEDPIAEALGEDNGDVWIEEDTLRGTKEADALFRFLDLSTAHVSPDTRRWLEAQALAGAVERGPTHTVAAYREGWFVHAPSSEELVTTRDKFPDDLLPILFRAAGIGAYYVRFDADGDRDERFPTYEDDESSLDGFPPEARAAIEAARAHPEDAGIADELAEPGELENPWPPGTERAESWQMIHGQGIGEPIALLSDVRPQVMDHGSSPTDRDFLLWVRDRLVMEHGDNANRDFIWKLEAIAVALPEGQRTPNVAGMAGKEKPTGSGIVVPATPMEHIVVSTARLGALIDAAKAVIDETKDDGAVDGWTALAMRLETLRAAIDDVF